MEEIAAAAIFFSPKKKRIRRLSYKKVNLYNGKCIKIQNKTENVSQIVHFQFFDAENIESVLSQNNNAK